MRVASDPQILCAGRSFASSGSLPESTRSGSKVHINDLGLMSESVVNTSLPYQLLLPKLSLE
jgi:hypothetical protein